MKLFTTCCFLLLIQQCGLKNEKFNSRSIAGSADSKAKTLDKNSVLNVSTLEDTVLSIDLRELQIDNKSEFTITQPPKKGTLSAFDGSGKLSYQPLLDQNGEDKVEFKFKQADTEIKGIIYIIIQPVNDKPVAKPQSYVMLTDNSDRTFSNKLTAVDVDSSGLKYAIVQMPTKGVLSLDENSGSFTYTPNNFDGVADSFTFKVNDGEFDSDVIKNDIIVSRNATYVVAQEDEVRTSEDTILTGMLGVTKNYDSNDLRFSIVSQPMKGTLVLLDDKTGEFSYTPNLDMDGNDAFTFKMSDSVLSSNTAAVMIHITPVNDAPVVRVLTAKTPINFPVSLDLAGSDPDKEGIDYYALTKNPDNGTVNIVGSKITYTPNPDFLGTDNFYYKAVNSLQSAPALISVSVLPQPIVTQLVLGDFHSCILTAENSVKCWGRNDYGQLGLGDALSRGDKANQMNGNLPYLNLSTTQKIKALAAGGFHNCALFDNNQIKCWGRNDNAQLGLGDKVNRGLSADDLSDHLAFVNLGTGAQVRSVTAGAYHSCALLMNGQVKCWGNNEFGQMGIGSADNIIGDKPGEMGDALLAVKLKDNFVVKSLSAADFHTCAFSEAGEVQCWGRNLGQLGVGDAADRGRDLNAMGNNLPIVNLGSNLKVSQLATGALHNCVSFEANNKIKCWGFNDAGQLSLGDTMLRGSAANQMGDSLPFVSLGTGRSALSVAAGGSSSCALLDNGTIKCWGKNNFAQLGLGDSVNRGMDGATTAQNLPGINLGTGVTVKSIAMGYAHSCVITSTDKVKCWGYNAYGQLGLEDTTNRGDGSANGAMGDSLLYVNLGY